jgi:hypothetical protein
MGQPNWMTVFALMACASFAQSGPSNHGETALKSQFVDVQPDVKLEVSTGEGPGATSYFSPASEAQLTFLTA